MYVPAADPTCTSLRSFKLDLSTPWHFVARNEPVFCWQDGRDEDAWFGLGVGREFQTLEDCRAGLCSMEGAADLPPRGFVVLAFDPEQPQWTGFAPRRIMIPRTLIRWQRGEATVFSMDANPAEPLMPPTASTSRTGVSSINERSLFTRDNWRSAVREIQAEISRGVLEKAVLSRQVLLSADRPFDKAEILEKLAASADDSIVFGYHEPGAGVFLGATPERLFHLCDNHIRIDSLAGTRPRGQSAAEDERLAAELFESAKDRHEQELVTRHISTALSGSGSTVRTGERRIRKLASVQHLHTSIDAELPRDFSLDDLLFRLHPTPATCGLPTGRARRIIAELEPEPRGLYAGVVGWIGADEADFAVAIRSGLIRGNEARLFGGAGIVADSDPDTEFEECAWKMEPLRRAL